MVFAILAGCAKQSDADIYGYLGDKAQVGWIQSGARESFDQTASQEGMLVHDFDSDGTGELVVFYTLNRQDYGVDSAHVAVMKQTGGRYEKLAAHKREGAPYINPLSGVWDINGDGKSEIIAVSWVGASFGGYLDIFAFDGNAFVSLNGEWNERSDIRAIKLEDAERDGVDEIVILHRFSYPDTYKWRKGKYVLYDEGGPYPGYTQQ